MNDINYVILIGRLTADPNYKITPNGTALCTFTIANNRKYKKQSGELVTETNFLNCTTWGKLSDFSRNYLKKGMQVVIEGRIRQNSWQSEEGKTQSSINVIVNNIQILTPKSTSTVETNQTQKEEIPSEIPEIDTTEDDIPF